MKRCGVVQKGPYSGQVYQVVKRWLWPHWYVVKLDDGSEQAVREIREECLEYEW